QTAGRLADDPVGRVLRADSVDLATFAAKSPEAALASVPPTLRVKELELISFAGDPAYIAFGDAQASWVVPVHGAPGAGFERGRIVDVIRKAIQPVWPVEVRTVSQYEAYYLDRRGERPLPVLFILLRATDSHSGYYIDPRTARVVGHQESDAWFNRWLYHGLH